MFIGKHAKIRFRIWPHVPGCVVYGIASQDYRARRPPGVTSIHFSAVRQKWLTMGTRTLTVNGFRKEAFPQPPFVSICFSSFVVGRRCVRVTCSCSMEGHCAHGAWEKYQSWPLISISWHSNHHHPLRSSHAVLSAKSDVSHTRSPSTLPAVSSSEMRKTKLSLSRFAQAVDGRAHH